MTFLCPDHSKSYLEDVLDLPNDDQDAWSHQIMASLCPEDSKKVD